MASCLCCDILGDCRKSPKMAILTILHVMKSSGYECQNYKIMVFRQSLEISQIFKPQKNPRNIAEYQISVTPHSAAFKLQCFVM